MKIQFQLKIKVVHTIKNAYFGALSKSRFWLIFNVMAYGPYDIMLLITATYFLLLLSVCHVK